MKWLWSVVVVVTFECIRLEWQSQKCDRDSETLACNKLLMQLWIPRMKFQWRGSTDEKKLNLFINIKKKTETDSKL
jgi:hypothetical protein